MKTNEEVRDQFVAYYGEELGWAMYIQFTEALSIHDYIATKLQILFKQFAITLMPLDIFNRLMITILKEQDNASLLRSEIMILKSEIDSLKSTFKEFIETLIIKEENNQMMSNLEYIKSKL